MAILYVEKLGGLAGFGGSRAHIRSRGQIDSATLSAADQKAVEALFQSGGASPPEKGADSLRFRISRITDAGTQTVDAPESRVPAAVASCVRDEFA
jgi:hypothetical protein